jgi:hypothetical protein
MRFALEDDFGPVVLGEWQDFDRRRLVMFLQDRLDVRRHPERVNAKQEATVVKDLEWIGGIRGQGGPESFGEVDHQRSRGASTLLLWILGKGGCSRGQPAETVVGLKGRRWSEPEGFIRIEYSRGPKDTATGCEFLDLKWPRICCPQGANDAMYAALAPVCICTERAPGVKRNETDDAQDECEADIGVCDVEQVGG